MTDTYPLRLGATACIAGGPPGYVVVVIDLDELTAAALAARDRAYVPYSGFAMGAAVVTDSGRVVPGAVVENVSLGLAMCAERVALFATVAAGERPVALGLASKRTDGAVTHPCGACLQVALELGGPELVVVAVTPDGEREEATVGALLPHGPRKRASA
jgi:cytidine deaminase